MRIFIICHISKPPRSYAMNQMILLANTFTHPKWSMTSLYCTLLHLTNIQHSSRYELTGKNSQSMHTEKLQFYTHKNIINLLTKP